MERSEIIWNKHNVSGLLVKRQGSVESHWHSAKMREVCCILQHKWCSVSTGEISSPHREFTLKWNGECFTPFCFSIQYVFAHMLAAQSVFVLRFGMFIQGSSDYRNLRVLFGNIFSERSTKTRLGVIDHRWWVTTVAGCHWAWHSHRFMRLPEMVWKVSGCVEHTVNDFDQTFARQPLRFGESEGLEVSNAERHRAQLLEKRGEKSTFQREKKKEKRKEEEPKDEHKEKGSTSRLCSYISLWMSSNRPQSVFQ